MEIRNCKSCGTMFNSVNREKICPSCMRKLEDTFVKVKEYIRENPNATIAEVSEENEVSVNQIRNWIREERLIMTEASADLGITCERCGKLIRSGRFCPECKKKTVKDLSGVHIKPEASMDKSADRVKSSGKDKMHFLRSEK